MENWRLPRTAASSSRAPAVYQVDCPKCGAAIEFYKDDTSRKCSRCSHRLVNPKMDFGCASYCQFAEQCLGTLPEEFTGSREDLLKDKVAVEMKRHFRTDFTSIRQATDAARHVENIGKTEGGNLAVLLCAAYLHGTGPESARAILQKAGAAGALIEEICGLLTAQSNLPGEPSLQAQILHDAVALSRLRDDLQQGRMEKGSIEDQINQGLFTRSAQNIAAELLSSAS